MSDVRGGRGRAPKRLSRDQLVHGSGGPIHHSQVEQARTRYVRVEDRPPPVQRTRGPIRANYFFRPSDYYFARPSGRSSRRYGRRYGRRNGRRYGRKTTRRATRKPIQRPSRRPSGSPRGRARIVTSRRGGRQSTTLHTEQLGSGDTPLTGQVPKRVTGL